MGAPAPAQRRRGGPRADRSHELQQHVGSLSPAEFRQRLWDFVLADHPDVLVLRFLRARRWEVARAVAMLASALSWRHAQQIDEVVVGCGESAALAPDDKAALVAQYRAGKAYVRGADRARRPVFVIRVRLHDPKLQPAAVMERFVLHSIETMRAMLRYPREKACLVFDLTGFALRNMDFYVVKFLGIWKIIRPWLDPVIASKVHFTSGPRELARFIAPDNLQLCYGGQDAWEFTYVAAADASENDRMRSEKKHAVRAERDALVRRFEQLSAEWAGGASATHEDCVVPPEADVNARAAADVDVEAARRKVAAERRNELAGQLRESFWKLGPYVRARTYYHRVGVIGPAGEVDYKAAP
ncbi:CRAL-TRIO domain-containing protein [Lasiosphaeria miniovina]|uniref:CRAL-TRIO domain-containing protein n=1 Tax=Lasiosphaeria miniovina TaxID=1954250 RepID=A0AA40AMK0_9PEZI|nr:CRAL-TRIO domain-containing protein [Lasiosphaeria miniovina]KAK0718603.1 CRAL-TRIO domain-containing protein [Lasiosphaeria miniovina]